ncbi:erythromycin esterase family protein [Paenibacillus sp. PR3]|uniref:Erythromycin esterase family protein n=1 Tax=Paenibacillus terricola TaxID=2763503 RepID=A0ABR8MTU2_9BACL|nr:erythromycin esterase family protein [Paenibacillus terricola]MBD3919378.1 erythromycin esterase family protein [Paenibacillus terricola]
MENEVLEAIRKLAQPYLGADAAGATALLQQAGSADFVLLGEASHGTSQFYTDRAALSKRLITEYGFRFIAVEGDWPACYTLNRYVKGYEDGGANARDALRDFERWPTWMWANREVIELAEWMREYNKYKPDADKVGFYGIDMYSLWESMEAILEYLESKPGSDLDAARKAFECFEPHGRDEQRYGASSALFGEGCEDEVIALLRKLQDKWQYADSNDREDVFSAEMNAFAVAGAESYYTTMIRQDADSWNVRDRHMVSSLERLMTFHGEGARAIVWEHNTHIGDARATDMAEDGMVNVGQLLREKYGDKVFAIGYGTYSGTVIAGRSWGMELEVMPVPQAMAKSWEELLHRTGSDNKLLVFRSSEPTILDTVTLGHRAIGVVYHPERERGNYVPSVLPERYDAFIYFDETTALSPLSREAVHM